MTPAELLDEIDYAGGTITVRADRSLDCQNIPPSLRDELVRHQFVITAILLDECEPCPSVPMDTRKLKKFLGEAQAQGVIFGRTNQFFEAEVPDGLRVEDFEPQIRANAEKIFQILFPAPPRYTRRRKVCAFCAPGTGCRKKYVHEFSICGACGHDCGYHYEAYSIPGYSRPGGCRKALWDEAGRQFTCPCPGPIFPIPLKPVKAPRNRRGPKTTLVIEQLELESQPEQSEGEMKS
jgi:hypothetical protein